MAILTFDTLVEKLKAAGVPEAQAKAMSEAFPRSTRRTRYCGQTRP
ncbi:MAG: hypothetical protein ACREYE_14290 [Gammaproteobacteria bacterium]